MYWKYLKAVLRHKWFVFVECCKLGIPWRGIVHDLSKFLPSEFVPYAQYFYGPYGNEKPQWLEDQFNIAWLHHQHRNRHHWQRWVLTMDSARGSDKMQSVPMPDKFRREMLADWRGAGRVYGNADTRGWYLGNRRQISMHVETRDWIEDQLNIDF